MGGRSVLLAADGAPSVSASEPAPAEPRLGKTYVLVHGAWHGGWCWRHVSDLLTAAGQRVFTPTQTGLGQSKHLLSSKLTLDTFITDIGNLIEAEELADIILVGHSFGGAVISGVADRMSERIRHLVFLDSLIIEGGQSPFSVLAPDVVAARRKLVNEQGRGIAIPPPPVTAFGIPENHACAAWVRRHLTPHPVGTYESPLKLEHPIGNGRPCTYIHCTSPSYAALEGARERGRRQQGWNWLETATGHDAMVTAPAELSRMLISIG